MKTKICSKCKQIKEASTANFYPNKLTLDKLGSWCKECNKTTRKYIPKLKKTPTKPDHKFCSRCKEEKAFEEFGLNEKLKSGLSSWCKGCQNDYGKTRLNSLYKENQHFRWKTQSRQELRDVLYRSGLFVDSFREDFEKVIGCTIEQFKAHIEARFQPGMSWSNYGKGVDKWSLDHIEPLDKSEIGSSVNHFTNLQPLWYSDNSRKRNK